MVHRAVFTLPDSSLNRLRAFDIAHDVENWGGSAWLAVGEPLSTRDLAEENRANAAAARRARPPSGRK